MGIVEQIEAKYRAHKTYGVQFSIDPACYSADIDDERIEFGKSQQSMNCGVLTNYQDILVDGKHIGAFLMERQNGKIFDPMTVSFVVPIADCSDENYDAICEANKDNPHFCDWDEIAVLAFATLQQLLDYKHIK